MSKIIAPLNFPTDFFRLWDKCIPMTVQISPVDGFSKIEPMLKLQWYNSDRFSMRLKLV